MSIYKQNRKKSPYAKLVANNISLEKILEKATTEIEYREIFYKRFLNADIYVLIQKKRNTTSHSLENTPIVVLQNNHIPVFTNPERIFDHNTATEEVDYIKVKGRAFLEMAIGETVIVNPFSKIFKTLVPAEISDLLNGSIFNKIPQNNRAKVQMEVMIGHPEVEPTELLETLLPYLSENTAITASYLGWTFNPKTDSKPHYILALELSDNNCALYANQIAELAKQHQKEDDILDIIQLEKDGTFSEFFYKQSTPFFKR